MFCCCFKIKIILKYKFDDGSYRWEAKRNLKENQKFKEEETWFILNVTRNSLLKKWISFCYVQISNLKFFKMCNQNKYFKPLIKFNKKKKKKHDWKILKNKIFRLCLLTKNNNNVKEKLNLNLINLYII